MSAERKTISIHPAPETPVDNETNAEETKLPRRLKDVVTSELVIALVGPVGSGCSTVGQHLAEILTRDYGYTTSTYRLSKIIEDNARLVGKNLDATTDRVGSLQHIGDSLREEFGNGYLAAKAIERIAEYRSLNGVKQNADGDAVPTGIRHVSVIDSLKNPEELHLLRRTYGSMLHVFGVFAPERVRQKRLKTQLNISALSQIQVIIDRDYDEALKHGQSVQKVFYQADVFVRNDRSNFEILDRELNRYVEILFGYPIHTPTKDESAMYAAYAEASKSACLSRQVGAAITNRDGEVIGLGRNDVPRADGGLYGEDQGPHDHRCYKWGPRHCHNDSHKAQLYQEIIDKLRSAKLIGPGADAAIIETLKKTALKSLIEYSRAVHAEMDAIVSVARANKPGLAGGTLYATTFPCHSCARHIVASGIARVLYVEPYPKSLALELHSDSVTDVPEENAGEAKVAFLQYSGVAAKNVLTLFSSRLTRKAEDGTLMPFNKKDALPLTAVSIVDFYTHEQLVVAEYAENEQKISAEAQHSINFDA